MQQVTGAAVIVGFSLNAPAVDVEVVPVEQHGAETSGKSVSNGNLIVAAAFGLAPDRIIGPLESQTEKLKVQLKAGKAAVETDPTAPTADTSTA